ncbi:MAG TPA: 2-dehydropantoate 2-reductase N-terminal domain-containing protein [Candidatus Baltobacteraceae bacterium]|nr:2-dehydropantoate 2-reductase N-terminal domain-containing protein [Candidatus Baltobacteraceae bacterium]
MKVYIVGKGAVGTYFGDMLAAAGVDVEYAARRLEDVTPCDADVALVATKAYDTDAAIASLRKAITYPEKCVFVSPQNGVGNEEKLAAAFGADNVVAAALTTPVDRDRDGRVTAAKKGGLALAPVGANAYNWLVATFTAARLNVKVVDDWRALKWSKLALNVVANASCAILNVLPNRLVHFERIFALEIRMIREVRAVMIALKVQPIDLPRYPVRALFGVAALPTPVSRGLLARSIANARGTKPPSLLLDLRSGKPQTEVDVLNGAVATAGHELGVPTPVNAVYCRVLDDIAHTPPLWAKYRERPEVLESEVVAEMKRAKALARR